MAQRSKRGPRRSKHSQNKPKSKPAVQQKEAMRVPSFKRLAITLAWYIATFLLCLWVTMKVHFVSGIVLCLACVVAVGIPMGEVTGDRVRRMVIYMVGLLMGYAVFPFVHYDIFTSPQFFQGQRDARYDRVIGGQAYNPKDNRTRHWSNYYYCVTNEAGHYWFRNDPMALQEENSEQLVSGFFVSEPKSEVKSLKKDFAYKNVTIGGFGYLFTGEEAKAKLNRQHSIVFGMVLIWCVLFFLDEFLVASPKKEPSEEK